MHLKTIIPFKMIIRLPRKKKFNLLLKTVYFLKNYLPLSTIYKAKIFADLEWAFSRMALELSFSIYDHNSHPLRANKFFLSKLDEIKSILDVGCGNGELAAQMYKKCHNITGFDVSARAISSARARFPWITFIQGRVEDLPLQKHELVVLSHILEHLDDPVNLLKKVKNVATYLYIEVPDFDSDLLNILRLDLGSNLLYSDNDHVSEFTREEICKMLKDCEIKLIDFESRHGCLKFWCSTK